jgi:long-chain acyl-CoA synthetase
MQIDPQRDTLVSVFYRRVAESGPNRALRFRDSSGWTSLSWSELHERVLREALRLRETFGVQPGDHVVLISKNSPDWIVQDLAIQTVRGINVPLHATLTGPQLMGQIRHCDPRAVLVEDVEQINKLEEFRSELATDAAPRLVVIGDQTGVPAEFQFPPVNASDKNDLEQQALDYLAPSDLATILYTSGTTGEAKGVMLTHANLVSNTMGSLEAFEIAADDLRLSCLPWSHIFARTCDLYTWIASGATLAIAESRETVLANCAELQPTLINAVPYFYDKIYQALSEHTALTTAGSVQNMLGGRMRLCVSGGAALPDHIAELFAAHGVPLVQGYGLTETSPVISACRPNANKIGTVGPPIRDVEVRIADDGEVLTRGPHVMQGYYNNPEATADAIRNDWFHTGDLGTLDADNFLRITGRKKEIIVLATGKNIAPAQIEGLLTQDPLILQALVCGSEQKFLSALIVPNPDVLRDEVKRRKIVVLSRQLALTNKHVLQLFQSRIDGCLSDLSNPEQVRRFRLLDRGFTIDSGELTPTLKLRRDTIMANFSDVIRDMYDHDEE